MAASDSSLSWDLLDTKISFALQVYMGSTNYAGREVAMWQLSEKMGDKSNSYTFYTGQDGAPVKMESVGELITTHNNNPICGVDC